MSGLNGFKGPEQGKNQEIDNLLKPGAGMNTLEEKLEYLKVDGKENEYKNFVLFLESKNNLKEYDKIINVIKDNQDDIYDYIEENGFPIGENFSIFIKDFFDIDTKEDKTEDKEDKTEDKVEKEEDNKVEKEEDNKVLKERFDKFLGENRIQLSKTSIGVEFISRIKKYKESNFDEKIGVEVESFLRDEGENLFKEIVNSPDLSKEDKRQLFEITKVFVKSISSSINIYDFEYYEGGWTPTGKPNLSGKIVTKLEDGMEKLTDTTVNLDLGHIPPKYDLGLLGSKYKFTNKLNASEISETTTEYLKSIKISKEYGKKLNGFGKMFNNGLLPNLGKIWEDDDFKDGLDSYVDSYRSNLLEKINDITQDKNIPDDLKITGADISDMKNIKDKNELKEKIINILNKLEALQKYVQEIPKQAYKKYEETLQKEVLIDQEKQEKQKETLKFIKNTGFALIPQDITDQLINEYKSNIFDINGLNLNPERLDLVNGMFGESPTEGGKTKWKYNLVMFLNKLVYGEVNPKDSPLNPNAFIGVMGGTINPTELQSIFEQKGIKSGSMWNINKMRENLKK